MKITYPLISLLLGSASLSAITIRSPGTIVGDPATITQDRFEANSPGSTLNPDFEFSGLDFSGVGWDSANSSKSVTLISDRHFIAARHHSISSNVSFLTASGVVSYAVSSQIIINNPSGNPGDPSGPSDIRIGTLTSPINLGSANINFYPVLDPSMSPVGQDIMVYGQRGRIGESTITTTENRTISGIDGYTNTSMYIVAAGADNDAYVTSGDSGGPSFIVSNSGNLILSGIHWAAGDNAPRDINGNPIGPATTRFNVDSDVSRYIDQAESQVSGLSITTAVPEPSSSLLILISLCTLTLRRKR